MCRSGVLHGKFQQRDNIYFFLKKHRREQARTRKEKNKRSSRDLIKVD
jgi:hypothetical protein